MKKHLLPWLFVFVASDVYAQAILRPPIDTSIWCRILPDTCVNSEINRLTPIPRLDVPRRIGLVVLPKDGGFNGMWPNPEGWSNAVAADELVGYGVGAVHVWPMVDAVGDDMALVYANPGLDLFIVRPMQHSFKEKTCDGSWAATWEGDGWIYGKLAMDLYNRFGDLDITVIITNWEGDWQLWGPGCREDNVCPLGTIWPAYTGNQYTDCNGDYDCQVEVCKTVVEGRAKYMKDLFEIRQVGVQLARVAHPNARLNVYHMITVNHTSDTTKLNVTRDIIPFLTSKPDLVGLSHWDKTQSISEALDFIQDTARYPRYRIVVAEVGGQNFREQTVEALRWGVAAVFGWTFKDWWGDGKHSFVDYETNEATQNMYDLQDLIAEYE